MVRTNKATFERFQFCVKPSFTIVEEQVVSKQIHKTILIVNGIKAAMRIITNSGTIYLTNYKDIHNDYYSNRNRRKIENG